MSHNTGVPNNFRMDYPITDGRPVLQGHADACAQYGHATWNKDGVAQGVCPRCGEITSAADTTIPPTEGR
jgi:hypothetical protein